MSNNEKFVVGKILKPRGLKGELKVQILTDFPERFQDRTSYWVGLTIDNVQRLKVSSVRFHQDHILLFFENILSFDLAEALKGFYLFIDESELTETEEDFYYDHQLIGLEVKDASGSKCGVLKNVMHYPANDVYELDIKGQLIGIPAIYEFVKEVNVDGHYIIIDRLNEFL